MSYDYGDSVHSSRQQVLRREQIPDAPYYVTATDMWMTRVFGDVCFPGKLNRLVFPCESYNEAMDLRAFARERAEMVHVYISGNKPRVRVKYFMELMAPERAWAWYRLRQHNTGAVR